ncbi:MAG: hypothetical protein HY456_02000 [Parcubacteria group bacterium]|nr:hypothetical protein [Parcubacteria group bacterium]
MHKENIVWHAPEYEYRHKDAAWMWLSVIFTIFLVIFAIWQKNYLFGAFVVLAETTVLFRGNRMPPIWQFEINDEGVKIGENKFYPFSSLEGFDMHTDNAEYKHLVLKPHSHLSAYVKIRVPVDESDAVEARMLESIPKKAYEESFHEALGRFLKF